MQKLYLYELIQTMRSGLSSGSKLENCGLESNYSCGDEKREAYVHVSLNKVSEG